MVIQSLGWRQVAELLGDFLAEFGNVGCWECNVMIFFIYQSYDELHVWDSDRNSLVRI